LDRAQGRRIQFVLLELIPATGCDFKGDPPIVTVVGHQAPDLHPPRFERVEEIAGCGFDVAVEAG
jgi:hypothetical protein